MKDKMEIINRILNLMTEKNVSASTLTQQLALSSSAITDWKNGKAKPNSESIIKLSNYFEVSIDWLLKGMEFSKKIPAGCRQEILSDSEFNLIAKYRILTPLEKSIVDERIQSYYLLHERLADSTSKKSSDLLLNNSLREDFIVHENQKSIV